MNNRTCSAPGCATDMTGKYLRKGYCENHYNSWRKYGTPMPSKEQRSAKRAQRAPVIALCTHCGVSFTAASRSKRYCSVYCITWNKYLGPGGSKYCSDCGDPMVMSRTSKPGPGRCKECSKHGFGGYDRGCRCDICAGAKANYMRDYVEQRIERDGVHPTTAL